MVHSSETGVGYYRVWQPVDMLKEQGVDARRFTDEEGALTLAEWAPLGTGMDLWITQVIDDVNALQLHKGMSMTHNIPWVVDIDDNIFDVPKNSRAYKHFYPGGMGWTLGEVCLKEADAVTVSTEQLAKVVRQLNPNVYVIPNYLDLKLWDHQNSKKDGIRVGWTGGATHWDDLKLLVPVFKDVIAKHPEVTIVLSGVLPDFFKEFEANIEYHEPVTIQDYPKHLASLGLDIGLAPLVDRPFNQAKSAIKWMEYSALSIPTVASPVGPYLGPKNLLRAFNKYEWASHIIGLIEDEKMRRKLGDQAFAEVHAEHDARKHIQERIDIYNQIIANHKKK